MKKTLKIIWWVFIIALLYYDIQKTPETIRTFRVFWVNAEVAPQKNLSASTIPIVYDDTYEYCKLAATDTDPVNQSKAGTPIPSEVVQIGPTATLQPQPTAEPAVNSQPTEIPTMAPTPTEVPSSLSDWKVKVDSIGQYNDHDFHIVLVGVGYLSKEDADPDLKSLANSILNNFGGVNVDFAYVESPINIPLTHIQQYVDFANSGDYQQIMGGIRARYPADGVVLELYTPLFLGSEDSRQGFALATSNDPNSVMIASHEVGHILSLWDGYKAYFPPGYIGSIPTEELFYIDSMPRSLVTALGELKTVPPIYEMGTCLGKKVYSFYDPDKNVMGNGEGTKPFRFNPIQIQIMNDYIRSLKGS